VTRTIGVGVIGCGNVTTRSHLPAYLERSDRVRVVAVADPAAERRAAASALAGLSPDRAFPDPGPLLALPDVDFVDICAPPRFHLAIASAAAKAGKHILCEKPAAIVPADAARMVDAAAHADVRLGFVHNYLCFPEFVAARRIIESGEIGDVRMAIVNYLGVPDLPGVDGSAGSWRHDPAAAGGGVLMDMLHPLYVAEYLIGEPARRVSAFVSGNDKHPRVEALALCRLETDGPVALVNVGWGVGPGGCFVEGTDGSIQITYRDGGTNPFVPLEAIVVTTSAGSRREPLAPAAGLGALGIATTGAIIDDFLAAIETGRTPMASGDDALRVLEVTVAAYESAALGRSVAVPLDRAARLYLGGVLAMDELDVPEWGTVRRQRLYAATSID
jgi:predicted dehydrogenase